LVDRFLKNFSTKRSDTSVNVYRSNFNIFFCWNLENNDNKFFVDIKKLDFMDFFDYASTELQWSPNRYANMWSSLNSLSTFIENILDEEYPDFRNQVRKIEKLPKANVREKTILSDKQIESLLNYLEKTDKQQACVAALIAYSGTRISEVFRFTLENLDISNTAYEGLFIETDEIKTKGRGKLGKKLNKYILASPFIPYYKEWIKQRSIIAREMNITNNSLFIRENGETPDASYARKWIKSWEKFLTEDKETNPSGEEVNIYAHCFRHYFCTYLARVGVEQELIVELFGWSSSEMYHIYSDLTAKDKKWKGLSKLKDLE